MSEGRSGHAVSPGRAEARTPESPLRRLKQRWLRWRRRIERRPSLNLTYRITVGTFGTLVFLAGIVAIPYPGPGWLIVFAGLGILASEFAWAHRLLHFARGRYDRFMHWFGQQSLVVRGAGALTTGAIVVMTLWLLGTLSLAGGWVGVDYSWLESPL
ncbi:uncharacterized protein (TIGR02611 family) [Rhodococcus ruber]|uniref:TIGR02611 family protein n=1 Tax=Rhodococcus ruber TaxID=1830 RepID=A0A098BPL5_9NOCA|nr:uncharacterized protein (TIGR02611 family) [Rhodococcus ruber]CDZ90623.1 conserved membrane hypothetical protein [Rhodococcus ruber]